jgi:copper oxidase (laccase) domain-containing protein
MLTLLERRVGPAVAAVVATERSDGDVHPLRVERAVLRARQVASTGRSWTMLDQVHGVAVREPDPRPGAPSLAGRGDVLVARRPPAAVAIWAADCAPIVLIGDAGGLVAAHGGWRGLAEGVVEIAVQALRAGGEEIASAVLGPVIHPCCYAFGRPELEQVAAGLGVAPGTIEGRDRHGSPALDLPAAVQVGLGRFGVHLDVVGPCTGCQDRWFSHRRRGDSGRHAVVAWTEPT